MIPSNEKKEPKEKTKEKVVFTNGCFDILHRGHIEYLKKAKAMGDVLIVGLNSDRSVKRLKGDHRPVNSEEDRAIMLLALKSVDEVIIFEEDTPLRLIKEIRPNVLVKGGDWTVDQIVGADVLKSYGGEIYSLPFIDGYSTTSFIEKIKKLILKENAG